MKRKHFFNWRRICLQRDIYYNKHNLEKFKENVDLRMELRIDIWGILFTGFILIRISDFEEDQKKSLTIIFNNIYIFHK